MIASLATLKFSIRGRKHFSNYNINEMLVDVEEGEGAESNKTD